MYLILLAIAPIVIIALLLYFKDRYEKEPIKLLIFSVIGGCLSVIPIIFLEGFLIQIMPRISQDFEAFYTAFIVAAFSEELFKYLVFILLIWKNKNFNEKFDGIVYAVFISLGFAMVENIQYVLNYGIEVAYGRAFTAVPAHALFGIAMGFHFAVAKFYPKQRNLQKIFALVIPIILHGIYDFILMSKMSGFLIFFFLYLVYLWIFGIRKVNILSNASIYRRKKLK